MTIRTKALSFVYDLGAALTAGILEALSSASIPQETRKPPAGFQKPGTVLAKAATRMPKMSADELRAIAEQLGIDPKDLDASNVQVVRVPQKASQPTAVRTKDGTIVPFSDIPLDKDGNPDPDWVDENCACAEHAAKRAAKAAGKKPKSEQMENGYI